MQKEFIVERQNQKFVLYAGLLDEAHEQGLKSISTTLLQIPNEENNHVAICQAVIEMQDGRTFSGIGDASPTNVARPMQNVLMRMAETRAKARALRDAINVGMAAIEELDDNNNDHAPSTPRSNNVSGSNSRPGTGSGYAKGFQAATGPGTAAGSVQTNSDVNLKTAPASTPTSTNSNGPGATEAQLNAITKMSQRLLYDNNKLTAKLNEMFGLDKIEELSKMEASTFIKFLQSDAA